MRKQDKNPTQYPANTVKNTAEPLRVVRCGSNILGLAKKWEMWYTFQESVTALQHEKEGLFTMKKYFVLLLVLLVLCLCACGKEEASDEQKELICGKWLDLAIIQSDDETELGAVLQINEDGTCLLDGDEYTWKAYPVEDKEDIDVELLEDDEAVYFITFYVDDEEVENAEIGSEDESYLATFVAYPDSAEAYRHEDYVGTWYHNESYNADGYPEQMEIRADGTLQLGNKELNWVEQDHEGDSNVYLRVFDDEQFLYYVNVYFPTNGLVEVTFQDAGYNSNCSYIPHAMLVQLNDCYWKAFSQDNWFNNWFSVGIWYSDMYVDELGDSLGLEFDVRSREDAIIIGMPSLDDASYLLTFTVEGDYPKLVVVNTENGEELEFYDDKTGYDPENPEARYAIAKDVIKNYLEGYSYWVEELDDYLRDGELLAYAYDLLQQLDGYKESQAYLERFSIYPDMLMEITLQNVDNLGNESSSIIAAYEYDADGRIYCTDDEIMQEKYGIAEIDRYDEGYFTYDDKGVVSLITVGSGNYVDAICTPSYDENGRLVSMHVALNSGEYTSTFTYDEAGRVSTVTIPSTNENEDPCVYTYTYDEAGKLVKKVKTYEDFYAYTVTGTYTYEGDRLIALHEDYSRVYYGNPDEWVKEYGYFYDEEGKLAGADYATTEETYYSYASQKYVYEYQDLYFYQNGSDEA